MATSWEPDAPINPNSIIFPSPFEKSMGEYQEIVRSGFQEFGKRVKKFFLILGAVALGLFAGYLLVCNFTYSKGTRSGYLVKITRKGFLFKTYEGTLGIAGISQTRQGLMSTNWDFSVRNREVYQTLDSLQGVPVKLYYREKLKAMPWQGDTPYFVYAAEPVKQ